MAQLVFCTTPDRDHAIRIATALKSAGFLASEISVLLPQRSETTAFAHEQHTKAPEGAVTGGSAGGLLGGTLGWMVGIGLIAIPGLGPFIAAGPILAAMSGAAVGATVGGLTGGLIGLGIPELEAKRYEKSVHVGHALISVACTTPEEIQLARDVFTRNGGDDITVAAEVKPRVVRAPRDRPINAGGAEAAI